MSPLGLLSPSSSRLSVCRSVGQKSRRFKTKREGTDYGNRPIKLAGKVIIQDISCLLPVHKSLGESYMWEQEYRMMSQYLLMHCSHLCVCTNISVNEICFLSCSVWTWTTSRKRVRRTQQQRSQSDGETWRRWRFHLFFPLTEEKLSHCSHNNFHSNAEAGLQKVALKQLCLVHLFNIVCVCVCARAHVQVWALASAATSQDLSPDSDPDTETPWARHPFGRQLLETLWVSVCWTVPCTVLQWTPVSFTDHWSLWLCEKLFIDN